MTDLDLDAIIDILDEPLRPEQKGPLRRYDKELRCINRRTEESRASCLSPTHYKVMGIPLCSVHALIRLNEMLVELGEHGISHQQ